MGGDAGWSWTADGLASQDAPKHLELDVKNLLVIKACQSLTSKGFVTTQFSWQYYYVRLDT